jgi:hypothetical protein
LIELKNALKEGNKAVYTSFKDALNDEQTPYKTSLNDEQTPYKTSLNDEQTHYKPSLNDEQTPYKTSLNDEQTAYKTSLNDEQTAYKASLNDEQTAFKEALNGPLKPFETQKSPWLTGDSLNKELEIELEGNTNVLPNKKEGRENSAASAISPAPVFKKNEVAEELLKETATVERAKQLFDACLSVLDPPGAEAIAPTLSSQLKSWIWRGLHRYPNHPDEAFVAAAEKVKLRHDEGKTGLAFFASVFNGELEEFKLSGPAALKARASLPAKPFHQKLMDAGIVHDLAQGLEFNLAGFEYSPGLAGEVKGGMFREPLTNTLLHEGHLLPGPLPAKRKAGGATHAVAG